MDLYDEPVSQSPDRGAPPSGRSLQARPFIGIRFDCCRVYARVYREQGATHYRGACPRCGCHVSARIAENGTAARFFVAG